MTSLKTITVFCWWGTILSMGSAAWSAEPNDTGLTLETRPVVLASPPLVILPTYAAGVARNGSHWFPEPGAREMQAFLEFVQTQGISEQQREFLQATAGGLDAKGPQDTADDSNAKGGSDLLYALYTAGNQPNAPQLVLYAVTVEDAKKMAEAYLRFARSQFHEWVTIQEGKIKKLSEQLTDEQQKLPEAERAVDAAKQKFEDLKKQVPYRDPGQALNAAAELDKMVNTAQVDIAGMQAMLKAIQNHQTSLPRDGHEALKAKLEAMYVEQAVALQGAEARRSMATKLRQQADSYVDLDTAWGQAEREKDRLTDDVSILPDTLRQAQEKLAAELQQEPKIINNQVFLYRVGRQNPPAPQPRLYKSPEP